MLTKIHSSYFDAMNKGGLIAKTRQQQAKVAHSIFYIVNGIIKYIAAL